MKIAERLEKLNIEIDKEKTTLIAVSKTKSIDEVLEAYHAGQRNFGENIVQELVEKAEALPKDIIWHQIGHLQSNKVKYIAPFIGVIHSVDSLRILKEINKQALRNKRIIDCLLQIHIAEEETKFGLSYENLIELLRAEDLKSLNNIRIIGLMGMATHTDNEKIIKEEFYELKTLFSGIKASFFRKEDSFKEISMGMSSDYKIAISQGSTMVRVGSLVFGDRPNP